MARIAYKALLRNTILSVHGVNARWLTVTHVQETDHDQIVWQGEVETFELMKHSQAKYCYAWSIEINDLTVVLTALKIPPVSSPQTAIHLAYTEGKLDLKRHLLQNFK